MIGEAIYIIRVSDRKWNLIATKRGNVPTQSWSGKSAVFLMESALTSHGSSKSNKKRLFARKECPSRRQRNLGIRSTMNHADIYWWQITLRLDFVTSVVAIFWMQNKHSEIIWTNHQRYMTWRKYIRMREKGFIQAIKKI
jgi:hypothetical protein